MQRDKWKPSKHSLLCSTHFKESCFVVRPGKRGQLLKEDAAPTEFPEINRVSKPEWKLPKKRVLHEPILPASPSKVRKVVQLDHMYETDKKTLLQENKKLRKRIKKLNQKVRRWNQKIENIQQLLHILKAKNLVASEQHLLLRENFGNMAREIFDNQIQAVKKKNCHSHCYSDEFALTLHYYSPKAYDFVCKILALPHPSSIRAWGASVDCSPGFLTNVINMLGSAVEENSWMSEVVLVADAMALHKSAIWDPVAQQYVGSVNYRTAIPEPPEDLATEALVFMVVGITDHFKHPIAYFLQNKCTVPVQGQLIKDGISLLHGAGLNVLAVVFDGCPTNQSTAKVLGCQMKVSLIKPWFPHPKLSAKSMLFLMFATW